MQQASTGSLKELIDAGWIDIPTALQLLSVIRQQENLLISGPVGSGKTTLLNAVAHEVQKDAYVSIFDAHGESKVVSQPGRTNAKRHHLPAGEPTLKALKEAIRRDDDVFIFDEIRKSEEVQMLGMTGSTGHQVLATVWGRETHPGFLLDIARQWSYRTVIVQLKDRQIEVLQGQTWIASIASLGENQLLETQEWLSRQHPTLVGMPAEWAWEALTNG